MRPNHHQLIAFAHVVRLGSFSAAAVRLGVTQSTITQHVAKLEASVGTQLLIRGRDGVSTTRTGQDFYELADRLAALDSSIAEKLQGFASLNEGHLKVIANAPQPALRVIRAFARLHPQVQIDFGLRDWTTATGMIRNRLADVALITDPPASDDWERHKLEDTRYVAYVPEDSPLARRASLSLRDLVGETVILPETGSLTERVVTRALKAHDLSFPKLMRTTTFPVMCEAVLQGIGIAIFLGKSSLIGSGLVEIPIKELDAVHETWIVVPRDRAALRLIGAFIAASTGSVRGEDAQI